MVMLVDNPIPSLFESNQIFSWYLFKSWDGKKKSESCEASIFSRTKQQKMSSLRMMAVSENWCLLFTLAAFGVIKGSPILRLDVANFQETCILGLGEKLKYTPEN